MYFGHGEILQLGERVLTVLVDKAESILQIGLLCITRPPLVDIAEFVSLSADIIERVCYLVTDNRSYAAVVESAERLMVLILFSHVFFIDWDTNSGRSLLKNGESRMPAGKTGR